MSAADHSDLRSSLVDDALAQSERHPPLEGDGLKAPDEECIATPPENDTEARQDQPQHPRDAGDDAGPPPIDDAAGPPPPHGEKAKAAQTPTEVRLALYHAGYKPLPLSGKNPDINGRGWQLRRLETNPADIKMWAKTWPEATNTGVLTKLTPALDLDIYDVDAAEAAEALVKDFFEDQRVPVRIGKPPKRAILFRTDAPFKKIRRIFTDPAGHEHAIEFLCDGQQLVVDGIHPDTNAPYRWHGGVPGLEVARDQLPSIDAVKAEELVDKIEKMLTDKFGLTLALKKRKFTNKATGKTYETADEGELIDCILKGASIHDSLLSLAGKYAYSGRFAGPNERDAIIEQLREFMQGSKAKTTDPVRWQKRFNEIPGIVDYVLGCREKRKGEEAEAAVKAAEDEAQAKEDEAQPFGPQHPPPPDEGPPLAAYEDEAGRGAASRPTIRVVAGMLDILATQAETALIAAGAEIFQRGSVLARPARTELPASDNRKTLAAVFSVLNRPRMVDELSKVAIFERAKDNCWVAADPPEKVADILLSRHGGWRLRHARGIINAPTLRSDGSLITQPGLDEATGYYLALASDFHLPPVSERPARSEAEAALKLLEGLLEEFPFLDDGGVSRSVALSALMTPIARSAMPVAPMHGVSAPGIGTGKSYLVNLAAVIATGYDCPVAFFGTSVEELEKKLNGLLLAGVPIISIDNVQRQLHNELLCQACERPLLSLRKLGKSDNFMTQNGACMYATGNNLLLAGDMIRRVLLSTMDAGVERPEQRKFKGDPVAAVHANRGLYIATVLTIIRAYLAAGRPKEQTPLGSYAEWCKFVREPLIWLGKADPAKSQETVREADPVLGALTDVMQGWEREIGLHVPNTALDVKTLAMSDSQPVSGETGAVRKERQRLREEFRDALIRVAGERGEIDTARLGTWLRSHRDRIVAKRVFVNIAPPRTVARWQLMPKEERRAG
jgi:hypothetical protein